MNKTLEILILMAGDGTRFKNAGIATPKPLLEIGDKTILEWTTNSFPFIKHYGNKPNHEIKYNLKFSIREEHNKNNNLINKLKIIYGKDISFKIFPSLTKGNLETAFLSVGECNLNNPLLILDADNKFNGGEFITFINNIVDRKHAALCCFEPIDKDEKWCFVSCENNNAVTRISEKKLIKNGMPIVGVFYYSTKQLFIETARAILSGRSTVLGEYYMSQTFNKLLLEKIPIYAHTVDKVSPIGTPEDVMVFKNENMF